jgi:thioredoxin reductase (NADPH)
MLTVEHIRAVPLFSTPVKRVASAVGEGSMAIALVHQYLQREGRARGRS